MQKSQQGFTLIELMIVIAIAGILMMIAIPSYQGYVAKAQATEALSLASNFKTSMTDVFANDGTCTANTVKPKSKNVASVATAGNATDNGGCTITSTMTDNVSVDLKGKTLVLTLLSDGTINNWECTSNIPQKYLPKGCENASGTKTPPTNGKPS